MPHFTLSHGPGGPLIDVHIGLSEPKRQHVLSTGGTPAAPIPVKALVDTGASNTSIDLDLVSALRLTPKRMVGQITPSTGATPHLAPIFDVAVFIPLRDPGSIHFKVAWEVAGNHLRHQGFDVLLGRDLLADALFVYDGKSSTFTLGF